MEALTNYLKMIQSVNPIIWAVIFIGIVVIVALVVTLKPRRPKQEKVSIQPGKGAKMAAVVLNNQTTPQVSNASGPVAKEHALVVDKQVGKGTLHCLVLDEQDWRNEGNESFYPSTIEKPVGDLFTDQFFSIGAACYFVRCKKDGSIEPYKPLMATFDKETLPQKAYRATHWEEAADAWMWESPFYASGSFWMAVICVVIAFVIALS